MGQGSSSDVSSVSGSSSSSSSSSNANTNATDASIVGDSSRKQTLKQQQQSSSSSSSVALNTNTRNDVKRLYHPSIFRYTCTGRLSLDSRNGGNDKLSTGICHGIQSQLEHIDHWRLSTRKEAIEQFEYKSAMGDLGINDEPYPAAASSGGNGNGGAGGNNGHPHTSNKTTLVDSGTASAADHAKLLSNVLLYPPPPDDEEENRCNDVGNENKEEMTSTKTTKAKTKTKIQSRPLEPQEQWSCYGSTEVDLLILRPQNEKDEVIAGVASYCAPGMTIRDLAIIPTPTKSKSKTTGGETTQTQERTTTVRLGILEIVYATVLEGELTNNNDNSNNNNKNHSKLFRDAVVNGGDGSKGDDKDNKEPSTTRTIMEGLGLGEGWITNAAIISAYPKKVIQSGKNIVTNMNWNSQLLYHALEDQFPSRTYEASQRITKEFDKTFTRTYGVMKKVVSYIVSDDDDDDGWPFDGDN